MRPMDKMDKVENSIIVHADRLLTPNGLPPFKGAQMKNINEMFDVDVVIENGTIVDIRRHRNADVDAKLVTPGLFDVHTHIPFVGSRSREFLMRAQGRKYVEILQSGGGIHYTTELVRNSTEEELFSQSKRYTEGFLSHGVVGIECKSGYGLDVENELKQLRVIKQLRQASFLKISSTFLGLHARPKDRPIDEYLDELKKTLPYIKEENLAQFVDAFCDVGAYAPDEIKQFMAYAKTLGFHLRLHADEMENVGAARLGIELGARSVDHVLKINDSDISTLSKSDVMVTLMPNTSFYLGEGFAPARKLIDSNIAIALGSDFNPGSAPIYQPGFVMHLAIRFLKMEPEEILTAYTANGAYLLGMNSGVIAPNFSADLVLWKTSEFIDIPYMFQENFVDHVLIDGRTVV